jgi:hypothetical protein
MPHLLQTFGFSLGAFEQFLADSSSKDRQLGPIHTATQHNSRPSEGHYTILLLAIQAGQQFVVCGGAKIPSARPEFWILRSRIASTCTPLAAFPMPIKNALRSHGLQS